MLNNLNISGGWTFDKLTKLLTIDDDLLVTKAYGDFSGLSNKTAVMMYL